MSPLSPEQLCIRHIAFRQLGVALNASQSQALWDDVRAYLQLHGLSETVDEVSSSGGAGLDTLPRGDVLSAMAHVLTGQDWPINGDSLPKQEAFSLALRAGMEKRGFVECPNR